MDDTLCIGVDVGGTNTDVVILQGNNIAAKAKIATTIDITSGVASCIDSVINNLAQKITQTPHEVKNLLTRVSIGTTHFINAVIQRKNLDKVSVIRLCGPSSKALPPFIDFPSDLKDEINAGCYLLNGGFHFDGRQITALDEEEVVSAVYDIKKCGVKNIVVSGVFASSNPHQETRVKEIILDKYPEASVTLSHEVGHIGILERENASILNESLKSLSKSIVNGFERQLKGIGITCPFYLTQNDGTLIKASDVLQFPVHTFSSGATNSLRGASFLSGVKDAIIVDIGGTSTDVGVLRKGFPKEASTRVKVGGVNTNFRMPDVHCIGLGGGSIITKGAKVDISKQSVERRLEREALVFGGSTLTTTDVAVAAGLVEIGNPLNVSNLDKNLCKDVLRLIKSKLEAAIDQVKLSGECCPVVVVGGGSILIKDGLELEGVSRLIKPAHFEVANAVGAALGQISGTFDRFVDVSTMTVEEAVAMAKESAVQLAQKNGAIEKTVQIIDVVNTSISYVAVPTRRIKVKAVGDLEVRECATVVENLLEENQPRIGTETVEDDGLTSSISSRSSIDQSAHVKDAQSDDEPQNSDSYAQPHIDKETNEWILDERDVDCLCTGAGIMGCGGGGSTYIGRLRLMELLRQGKKLRVIDPISLKGQKGVVLGVAFMGAPGILIEKLIGGKEITTASEAVLKVRSLGICGDGNAISNENRQKFKIKREGSVEVIGDVETLLAGEGDENLPILALLSLEIGGMNSVEAIISASQSGLPVIDCDGMGRALPKLEHLIPVINGCSPIPAAISDEKGEVVAVVSVDSPNDLENFFRLHTIRMGCTAGLALTFSIDDLIDKSPLYTLSRAWHIGNAIMTARKEHKDPVNALIEQQNAAILIIGKVVEVYRETRAGFDYGYSIIDGLAKHSGKKMKIEFQNENLVAVDMVSSVTIASVPDLISIVDSDTGEPVSTEENRYGLRVSVILLPAMPIMCTPQSLKAFGPDTFGYSNLRYNAFATFKHSQPVTKLQN
eukprot:gene7000-7786_t